MDHELPELGLPPKGGGLQPSVPSLVDEILRLLLQHCRRPVATYRVQLHAGFGFPAASEIIPYLHSLGISDLYTSPYLKAAPGSLHGYDVVDHHHLNPELGTHAQFDDLVAKLAAHQMEHVLDFVPNHVAIGSSNLLWMDVLENGPSSIYAHFFDIDWKPIKEELENQVLVPILGDQYGTVLERGELRLEFEHGSFFIRYYDQRLPVAPQQYASILSHRIDELHRQLPAQDVHFEDLLSVIAALGKLPSRSEKDPVKSAERHREKEVIKRRISSLCSICPKIRAFIEENVGIFNGVPGDPRSFDLLDRLLRKQIYRLAYWRVAGEEINYRRFFDINGLAAIRMEDPRVIQQAHALIFQLVAEGKLSCLRIDHPDGLYAPADYFARLQEELALMLGRRVFFQELDGGQQVLREKMESHWSIIEPMLRQRLRAQASNQASPFFRPVYVVVEKILAHDERMPTDWAVHGTTGYDFMNVLNGLFVDRHHGRAMDDIFTRFTGLKLDYQDLVYQKRRETMADSMSSEINVLARRLNRISEHDRRTRDFTLHSLWRALVEVIACFPVYRTYISANKQPPDDHDCRFVEEAVRRAKGKNPTLNASLIDFIRDVLLGYADTRINEAARKERLQFVLKLQQVTAPVMAKSVEDTVYYLYNRLVSLNEVGGEPDFFGTSVEAFHANNEERAKKWPGSLLSTSTHDTKRGEDVRARINVLSEIPSEWKQKLAIWSRLNRRFKTRVNDTWAPDRNEEILLYQSLIGTLPFSMLEGRSAPQTDYRQRVQAYMNKAIKEAKVNTSWMNPNESWEKAVDEFVLRIFDQASSEKFWKDLTEFTVKISRAGAFNSLSQVMLKIASPGVCDFYQGNELWSFSLVDPDNRRPVDFVCRRDLLSALDAQIQISKERVAREVLTSFADGRIKLFVTSQALRLRAKFPALFREGDYVPLWPEGQQVGHLVAFARRHAEQTLLVMAPRLVMGLIERLANQGPEKAWGDTFVPVPWEKPEARYQGIFTDATIQLTEHQGKTGVWAKDVLLDFPLLLAINLT